MLKAFIFRVVYSIVASRLKTRGRTPGFLIYKIIGPGVYTVGTCILDPHMTEATSGWCRFDFGAQVRYAVCVAELDQEFSRDLPR